MGEVVYIHQEREPPPAPMLWNTAELMNTRLRQQTWCLWNACHQAKRGNTMALMSLLDFTRARPSERLACAAGGTLASLGHGYALDDWGAA